MKLTTRLLAFSILAIICGSLLVNRHGLAVEYVFSRGDFVIRLGCATPPCESAIIRVAPPKFFHPTASLFLEEPLRSVYNVSSASPLTLGRVGGLGSSGDVERVGRASAPEIVVAPPPSATVYGAEYRTAPYLAARQSHATIRRDTRHAPSVVTAASPLATSLDASRRDPYQLGPYPTRYNPFQPTPYFGPGPHYPTPNHFGGMTPLGPGPAPSFGPR